MKYEELRTKKSNGESLSEEELFVFLEGEKIERKYKMFINDKNDSEEKEIKELSQRIAKVIPANIAIELGEKLYMQKEKNFHDSKNFYVWAEKMTDLKHGSIDEYIDLYTDFKEILNRIPKWMNKSHITKIKKYASTKIQKENLIDFIEKIDKDEYVTKNLKSRSRNRGESHISANLIEEIILCSPNNLLEHENPVLLARNSLEKYSSTYKSPEKQSSKPPKHGKQLIFSNSNPVTEKLMQLISYEPIDEQGFVGLFCLIFTLLKEYGIIININEKQYKFDKIDFIRVKFPDARIQLTNIKGKYNETLDVEFEFESSRYISHKHHRENEICHLIICWEDNLLKKESFDYELPPTLSIKELLKNLSD